MFAEVVDDRGVSGRVLRLKTVATNNDELLETAKNRPLIRPNHAEDTRLDEHPTRGARCARRALLW
jgi:hypothetical protein